MNWQAVTSRRELWISLLALLVIALMLPAYIVMEPTRLQAAEQQILLSNLDEAMTLYAQNCALCHGMAGEGIGANPPLNAPGLASMDYAELAKVIARGRHNTAMPAWAQEDGGPLSDYQVGQLVALVQRGDWGAAQDRVVNLGLQPLIPFAAQPDAAILAQVQACPMAHGWPRGSPSMRPSASPATGQMGRARAWLRRSTIRRCARRARRRSSGACGWGSPAR